MAHFQQLEYKGTVKFSLNDFLWIQQIQWITTKFKSSMITRDIYNRYIPWLSSKKEFPTTICSLVSVQIGDCI